MQESFIGKNCAETTNSLLYLCFTSVKNYIIELVIEFTFKVNFNDKKTRRISKIVVVLKNSHYESQSSILDK